MKISFLSKNSNDLKVIARWYYEEWGHFDSSITEDRIFERLSSKLEKEDDFLSVITIHENEDLVAVADLKYTEHKEYPEYKHWVGGIFVHPEHRGKGYAAALIAKTKERVTQLSISDLYLQCEEHNAGLYLRYGFKALHSAVYFGVNTTIFKFNANT